MKKTKQKPGYEKAILSAKRQFIQIAGKEAWERESHFAIHRASNSSWTSESVIQAMLAVAYTGVTLNSIFKEAYFDDNRDGKCFLNFTYRGLIKIATSDGAITSMSAGVVYSWDTIDCRQGTNAYLHVTPNLNPPRNPKDVPQMDATLYPAKDPDEIARNPKLIWEFVSCAYSIATFSNGQQDFIIAPKWKLLKTWNLTCANANPINQAFPEEWLRKTAIIYHSKTLPKAQRLVTAVAVLNEHEGIKKKKQESKLMRRMWK